MKVIEALPVDRFENVLDAGAELLEELKRIMRERGLPEEDAPSIVCVAAAGALHVSPVPHKDFRDMINMSTTMWRKDGEGLSNLEFDPPHRTEDAKTIVVAPGN